mgnify:CR=1 FL=1
MANGLAPLMATNDSAVYDCLIEKMLLKLLFNTIQQPKGAIVIKCHFVKFQPLYNQFSAFRFPFSVCFINFAEI